MKNTTKKYICKDCSSEILTKKGAKIIFCPICGGKTNIILKEEALKR